MASAMKMTRMKSFVKKWQNLARVGKVYTSKDTDEDGNSPDNSSVCDADQEEEEELEVAASIPEGFEVVFIGKSRRRYVINARHLQHPLFKALHERSEVCGIDQSLGLTLGCEVVLFEHLLWMLDSDDPAISQSDSIHELAELYMPSDGSSLLRLLKNED